VDFGVLFCPNSPNDDRHDSTDAGKQRHSRSEHGGDLFSLREHVSSRIFILGWRVITYYLNIVVGGLVSIKILQDRPVVEGAVEGAAQEAQ